MPGHRTVRAVIYGVGEMGSLVTRLLHARGVEIVGAIARSPAKTGRDLGTIAGLDHPIGVTVEDDADAVLSRGADIAVICVGSYLETMHTHFETCLRHKVNVLTIEEETIYPWTTAPGLSQKLDQLAKDHGVTLAASGAQDVFWINLVTTLMGAAHRVDSVDGHCRWHVDDYGPEVAQHLMIGRTKTAFDRSVAAKGWPEFVARQTLEAIVARLELTAKTVTSDVVALTAEKTMQCRALGIEVEPGCVMGTIDRTRIVTEDGIEFSFAMEGRLYDAGETDSNHWRVCGEPDLDLSNTKVPYRFTTCSTLVNRIPDVIDAAPGLLSLDRLGAPRYRHRLTRAVP